MSNAQAASENFDSITIERGGRGMTYVETAGFTVYGHSIYARGSVLEGERCRSWLDHFETLGEAQVAYPTGSVLGGSSFAPPSLGHLHAP